MDNLDDVVRGRVLAIETSSEHSILTHLARPTWMGTKLGRDHVSYVHDATFLGHSSNYA